MVLNVYSVELDFNSLRRQTQWKFTSLYTEDWWYKLYKQVYNKFRTKKKICSWLFWKLPTCVFQSQAKKKPKKKTYYCAYNKDACFSTDTFTISMTELLLRPKGTSTTVGCSLFKVTAWQLVNKSPNLFVSWKLAAACTNIDVISLKYKAKKKKLLILTKAKKKQV